MGHLKLRLSAKEIVHVEADLVAACVHAIADRALGNCCSNIATGQHISNELGRGSSFVAAGTIDFRRSFAICSIAVMTSSTTDTGGHNVFDSSKRIIAHGASLCTIVLVAMMARWVALITLRGYRLRDRDGPVDVN